MKKLLLALALTAAAALGADATGNWSGAFVITRDGETRNDTAYLKLTQDGAKITGSAGPNAERQFPIKTGTIDGSKIKLELDTQGNGPHTFVLMLEIDGDRITGDAAAEGDGGQKMTAKLDLKREK